MRQALYRISGVDLTWIDAIGVETVQAVLSEYGPDLSRFPTEKQFVQHVSLALHRPTSVMISSVRSGILLQSKQKCLENEADPILSGTSAVDVCVEGCRVKQQSHLDAWRHPRLKLCA